jgi:penicillin-binding protein 1A
VHELTLPEAAYIAALPKAPTQLPPVPQPRGGDRAPQLRHRPHGRERLRQAEQTARPPSRSRSPSTRARCAQQQFAAGFFAEEVRRELPTAMARRSCYEGGLSIRTTLDPKMQVMARKALTDGLIRFDEARGWRGAIQRLELTAPRLGHVSRPRCRRWTT